MNSFILLFMMFMGINNMLSAQPFFSDGFESGDCSHTENGVIWQGFSDVTVSDDRARSGQYSLKFHYSATEPDEDANSVQRFTFGNQKQDVYVRYYIYFPTNYEHRDAPGSDNNKAIRLWGDEYNNPIKMGASFWPLSNGLSNMIMDVRKSNGPSCTGSGGMGSHGTGWSMTSDLLGQWTCFEFHFRHDNGSGNGVTEFWVNGVKKISNTGISFVDAPCDPEFFRDGYLMGWSNTGFDENTDIYIDDVVFSNSYIGPDSTPPPTDPNLALGKTVSTNGQVYAGYEPALAVDGSTGTLWSTDAQYPTWLEADLADVYSINSTEVVFYSDLSLQYKVYVKTTSEESYTLVADQSANQAQGTVTDNFGPVNARYVKLEVNGCTNCQSYFSITEFRVFDNDTPVPTYNLTVNSGDGDGTYVSVTVADISADAPPAGQEFDQWTGDVANVADVNSDTTTIEMLANATITATYNSISTNLALNKTVSTNGQVYAGYEPALAVDDSTGTLWSTDAQYPTWLEADLCDVYSINSTEVVFYSDLSLQYKVYVKTTSEGSYTLVGDQSANQAQDTVTDNFGPVNARYVKLEVNGCTSCQNYFSITEFRVFGDATPVPTYALRVNSGVGDGTYVSGTVVDISADAPPAGQEFDQWTGDVGGVANVYAPNTTIAMPATSTTITATYATPTNVALNKTVSTNGQVYAGYEPALAVDGSTGTLWSTDAQYPTWLEADLCDVYSINSTEVVFYSDLSLQYKVYVKTTSEGSYTLVGDQSANQAQDTVTDNFGPVNVHYVKLEVLGCTTCQNYFSITEFRVFGVFGAKSAQILTGVEEESLSAGITVYPNPASTSLTISGGTGQAVQGEIAVYKMEGRKIYQTPNDVAFPHQVDISTYVPGIYLVRVLIGGKYFTKKVVKE